MEPNYEKTSERRTNDDSSKNKKIQSDHKFLRGPRKSKACFHDFIWVKDKISDYEKYP